MITGTKKDAAPLKHVHDRDRWAAIKIWGNSLLGNDIELGDYTWKGEKATTQIMAKWMNFHPGFLEVLEEYEGGELEFMPEE